MMKQCDDPAFTNSPAYSFGFDWENPSVFQRMRVPMHTPSGAYESGQQALSCDRMVSKYVVSLDGMWKFCMQKATATETLTYTGTPSANIPGFRAALSGILQIKRF